MRPILALLHKEALLELRQRTTLGGIALYVAALVFVTGLTLGGKVPPRVWIVVLWLLLALSALGALTRSFVAETPGQLLLLYQWARASDILLAKLLYNTAIMWGVSLPAAGLYSLLIGAYADDLGGFIWVLLAGGLGLASSLTPVSALVARAGGQFTLMAVLSLPLLVPQLLVLIQATDSVLRGELSVQPLYTSLGLSGVATALGLLLFGYVWQE